MFRLQRAINQAVGMWLSLSGLKQPTWKLHGCYSLFILTTLRFCTCKKLRRDCTHAPLCVCGAACRRHTANQLLISPSPPWQSCGISSRTTIRRSRWTRATRPSSSATSPKASPRLRSATASSRSGWKPPKVPIFPPPPPPPCLRLPIQSNPIVISWNTQMQLSGPDVKPVIRALSENVETWESTCLFFYRFAPKLPGREEKAAVVCGWYADDAWGL